MKKYEDLSLEEKKKYKDIYNKRMNKALSVIIYLPVIFILILLSMTGLFIFKILTALLAFYILYIELLAKTCPYCKKPMGSFKIQGFHCAWCGARYDK